jgi:hypothetical protein
MGFRSGGTSRFRLVWPFALFVTGFLAGVSVVAGFSGTAKGITPDMASMAAADHCLGGNEVSGFVCRNTWIAMTKQTAGGHR